MFLCKQEICPNGYTSRDLPLSLFRISSQTSKLLNVTSNQLCVSCGIRGGETGTYSCPSSIYDSLCVGSSKSRLQSDSFITCDANFLGLFVPLSTILTLFVVIGIPF